VPVGVTGRCSGCAFSTSFSSAPRFCFIRLSRLLCANVLIRRVPCPAARTQGASKDSNQSESASQPTKTYQHSTERVEGVHRPAWRYKTASKAENASAEWPQVIQDGSSSTRRRSRKWWCKLSASPRRLRSCALVHSMRISCFVRWVTGRGGIW
jgi:hypothetical protein